jgi:hypothetical protein
MIRAPGFRPVPGEPLGASLAQGAASGEAAIQRAVFQHFGWRSAPAHGVGSAHGGIA